MTISELITKGSGYSPQEIESLKAEIMLLLERRTASRSEILLERSLQPFPPTTLELFFRKEERSEKIIQVLQYLLAFIDRIPEPSECKDPLFNPIGQFRECVKYEVDLLLEEDVNKAVFNEINRAGSFDGSNIWDFKGRIIEKNRELNELLETNRQGPSNLFTLGQILEQLSLFWFDVRKRDICRIRCSDVYIYILAVFLQKRCRENFKSQK